MRNQLNELMKLAKQLRSTIKVNNIEDQTIEVSTWITVRKGGPDYYAVSFLANRKLDIDVDTVDVMLDPMYSPTWVESAWVTLEDEREVEDEQGDSGNRDN